MPGALSRYAATFRHRDFRLLVITFLVESIGTWAGGVVLAVYAFDRTHSLPFLAAMASARWIPGLLLAPLAGVLADRYDRRTVMMVAATATGAVAVLQVLVVGLNAPVWILLVLQVATAATNSPYRPAAGALTPEVVDEASLPAANSLFAALENLVVVIGPAIGGLVLLLNAPAIGLGLSALSSFGAAALAQALHVRSHGSAEAGTGLVAQLLAGVRAIGEAPTAAVLLLFAAIDTLLAGAYTVTYIPISEHLGTGTAGYGYLLAAAAVGGVIGAAFVDRLSVARRLTPVIVGGVVVQALPYALTPLTASPVVGALLQVVSGIGMVLVDVLALTALQREVSSGQLSRVLGLLDTVCLLASVVGSFGASVLLSALPYAAGLVTLGGGVSVVALLLTPLALNADRRAARTADALGVRVAVLDRLELFEAASRTVQERLAAAMQVEQAAAGTVLIGEGDAADALWVLVDGTLSVVSSTQHGAIPDVVAPDVVGEIGVLRRTARTATVTAATDATLWRLSASEYLTAITPERVPLLLLGTAGVRLRRTQPGLVPSDAA